MIETRLLERTDSDLAQADSGGDEVRVVAESSSLRNDLLEIRTTERLAARQTQLHRAQSSRLAQYPAPLRGGEFAPIGIEIHRVGAKGTVQRTFISQLGHEPQGNRRSGGRRTHELITSRHSIQPFCVADCRKASTSGPIAPDSNTFSR